MRNKIAFSLTALAFSLLSHLGHTHCEIPCGIYDDQARVNLMKEDAKTVEKGIAKIAELSKDPSTHANQITRWVSNKDAHANNIKETVAFYFLSQRIKSPKSKSKKAIEAYHNKLVLLHDITVAAMKTKQTTDPNWAQKLNKAIKRFEKAYFKDHKH